MHERLIIQGVVPGQSVGLRHHHVIRDREVAGRADVRRGRRRPSRRRPGATQPPQLTGDLDSLAAAQALRGDAQHGAVGVDPESRRETRSARDVQRRARQIQRGTEPTASRREGAAREADADAADLHQIVQLIPCRYRSDLEKNVTDASDIVATYTSRTCPRRRPGLAAPQTRPRLRCCRCPLASATTRH